MNKEVTKRLKNLGEIVELEKLRSTPRNFNSEVWKKKEGL